MAEQQTGGIEWRDLTVEDADTVRDFYAEVAGWNPQPVSMGDYNDYNMLDSQGNAVAGVCHARGGNADMPAQWLMYVTVADIDASIASCTRLGGAVVAGPKQMGSDRYCVIRDPAGAVLALYQKA